mmetsp:Transcript_16585/g.24878  ORF Transcript_16585/g.24878 Transcript_16585/m.24878 type:complete len:629 (-) Transcript_16585:15-1901(-)
MAASGETKPKKSYNKGGGNSKGGGGGYKGGKGKFDNKKRKDPFEDLSPANKKRALKAQRQSFRPHAETVIAAKELWNKLRLKGNTQAETEKMMVELMTLLTGKFNKVALQHDASRVVQAAVQFGNKGQRKIIVRELCEEGSVSELAKSQYAHFVVLKMIKCCVKDDESMRKIVKGFKGQMVKLAVHAVGARVVEFLFANFPTKITTKLKLEFYGNRFGLFNDGDLSNATSNPTIHTIVKLQPEGKDAALESLLKIINKGIEKGLYSFAYFQQLICEYMTASPPTEIRSLCSSLVDHSIHLLSTRAGSRVVAECAAYGTPKDRKRILKSLKGYTRSSLFHSDAYIALLRILDVTDDTVNVQKALLAELQVLPEEKKKMNVLGEDVSEGRNKDKNRSPLLDLVLSDTGSKLFLLLLMDEGSRKKYFDPNEMEVLRANPTIKQGDEEVPTSKKNANTRRMELLKYMQTLLTDCCKQHADQMLLSRCGCKVLREVYITFSSKELSDAIVEACDNGDDDDEDMGEYLSVFEHPVGQVSIKNLIICDSDDKSEGDKNMTLTSALYTKYEGTLVDDIGSSNRGAFVLAAMIDSDSSGAVMKEIVEGKKEIKERIKQCKDASKPCAGFEALIKALK